MGFVSIWGGRVLRLLAEQLESLWDEALPFEVRELPEDLAALDRLLDDPAVLGPIVERFRREVIEERRAVLTDGRPTIAMETYVRLMVLKQRYRWGYRSLVAEVSDSIHLRRFCRISLSERVADESTVRKLTRRIGPETVNDITRVLIVAATRSKRFRPRAVRIDSTVIEGDVKYPTDSGLAAHGVRVLAREGKKLARLEAQSLDPVSIEAGSQRGRGDRQRPFSQPERLAILAPPQQRLGVVGLARERGDVDARAGRQLEAVALPHRPQIEDPFQAGCGDPATDGDDRVAQRRLQHLDLRLPAAPPDHAGHRPQRATHRP
jgi:IS5 family transposase